VNKIFCLFFFIIFFSCEFEIQKKISADKYLEEELRTIDWNSVDKLPLLESCLNSNLDNQKCFVSYFSSQLKKNLLDNDFVLNRTLIDTIYFNLKIDKVGNVSYEKIQINEDLNKYQNAIEMALNVTIKNLPKVYPAIKRGQPVDVEFNFPLLISTENR
tara:strand:+ start:196 stop:672 length:477 start_codon:yes stop_codon:yes gene_type:complete